MDVLSDFLFTVFWSLCFLVLFSTLFRGLRPSRSQIVRILLPCKSEKKKQDNKTQGSKEGK